MLVDTLPPATAMLADKGYDADWYRKALAERDIAACIPSNVNRKIHIPHDRILYRQRHLRSLLRQRPANYRNRQGALGTGRASSSSRPTEFPSRQ